MLRNLITAALLSMTLFASAQRTEKVHGVYTFTVDDNTTLTLAEAKRHAIEEARAQAIKDVFGELVTSDVLMSSQDVNGKSSSSFISDTRSVAKGDWLGDTQTPVLDVTYSDGILVFKAEVWGQAREIVQAKVDLDWKVLTGNSDTKKETYTFKNKERIFVNFKSPADGYVAIYLLGQDNTASCLLPYRKSTTGIFTVKGGKKYTFFDKAYDPMCDIYNLTTQSSVEDNQLVIIYSPNSFIKANDDAQDAKMPRSLSTVDFRKWLLKCQRRDKDMVVNKKWIKITNNNNN